MNDKTAELFFFYTVCNKLSIDTLTSGALWWEEIYSWDKYILFALYANQTFVN